MNKIETFNPKQTKIILNSSKLNLHIFNIYSW